MRKGIREVFFTINILQIEHIEHCFNPILHLWMLLTRFGNYLKTSLYVSVFWTPRKEDKQL